MSKGYIEGANCYWQCGTPFAAENAITINPTDKKEIESMKHTMEEKKAKAKAERKAKKAEKKANGGLENGTKRKLKDATDLPPAKKITTIAPSSATAAVVNKVKEELQARNKQQKSSAIQSIYRKKGEEKKQTYLSAGTFTRY